MIHVHHRSVVGTDVLVLLGVRQSVRPVRLLQYLDQALLGRGRQRMCAALLFGAQQSSPNGAHLGRQVLQLRKGDKVPWGNRHTARHIIIRSCGVKCLKKLTLLSAAEAESAMYIFAAASKSSSSCKCSLYRALPKSKMDSSFE